MARNILLIVADDAGIEQWPTYSASGGTPGQASTPNITALASGGIAYRRFYTQPFCSPTRASMMTGRRPSRNGVGNIIEDDDEQPLLPGEFILPEAVKALNLGHRVAVVGKWHLGNSQDGGIKAPNLAGFDYACTTVRNLSTGSGSLVGTWPENEKYYRAYYNFYYSVNGEQRSNKGEYSTDFITDRAIAWWRSQGDAPKMLMVNYHAPHEPYHRPPCIEDGYRTDSFNRTSWPCALKQPPEQGSGATIYQYFKAALECMDRGVGRLMDEIDTSDTTVIFIADNGTAAPSISGETYPAAAPYNGGSYDTSHAKRTAYDPGIHCPLFVYGNDVASGGRYSNVLVESPDLYLTILELLTQSASDASVRLEKHGVNLDYLDAVSFRRSIVSASVPPAFRTTALVEAFSSNGANAGTVTGNRAIIGAGTNFQYKLYWKQKAWTAGSPEMYDLTADPKELTNLMSGTLTADQQTAYTTLDDAATDYYESVQNEIDGQ